MDKLHSKVFTDRRYSTRFGSNPPLFSKIGRSKWSYFSRTSGGVKDEERVRRLLQQSASLEFYLTYEAAEIWPILQQIDQTIINLEQAEKIITDDTIIGDTTTNLDNDTTNSLLTTNDTSSVIADTSASLLADITTDTTSFVSDSTLDEALTKEEYLKKYPFTGRIYPAIDQDKNILQGPVIGFVSASDTSAINKYLKMPEIKALLPQDLKLAWTVKPDDRFYGGAVIFDLIALKTTADRKAQLRVWKGYF